ncbi:helix-turn-helix domain-containing protein [Dyella psychrodurans]|uniref:XRE family transcriptional regulator n=1 Tax=Dyella psychrodurans TaxID=1927960 RepID=A0A370XCA9_9GAMM|nr:helix-turn-helix transcriptional regulator [Dyella psychrodurans]RDS85871.1 XRE family transcriptional regulator [Dyella psychrodurans]
MAKSLHTKEYRAAVDLLRELREASGQNQTVFAEQIGRTQTFVSAAERASVRLDIQQLATWIAACGLTLEEWGRRMDRLSQAAHAKPTAAKSAAKSSARKTSGAKR